MDPDRARPARVAMVLLNPYTHDTRVEKEAAALHAAGYHVTVLAEQAAGLADREQRNEITVIRVARRGGPKGIRFLRRQRDMAAALADLAPDVIHANDSETLQIAGGVAARLGVPFIYDAHDLWLGRMRRNRSELYWRAYLAYYGWLERRFLPRAAAHITVSEPIARHLERSYHLPSVEVVANYPEITRPLRRRELRSLRGAETIPADAPVVLYIGAVMSGRGVEELIVAMAEVPEAHLVLLGGWPMRDLVAGAAAASGVEDRVHSLPPVPSEQVLDYAASATLGVSPILPACLNYRYSLPNKLFQMMAAGIPVIASDFPQVGDVVVGSGAGHVVDPTKPAAIASGIRALLADPDAAARAGARGRQAVEERYAWRNAAAVLTDVYRRVVPPGQPGLSAAAKERHQAHDRRARDEA